MLSAGAWGNLFLLVFLAEQVGMGAGIEHQKFQFVTCLLPYQQPVGLDVWVVEILYAIRFPFY